MQLVMCNTFSSFLSSPCGQFGSRAVSCQILVSILWELPIFSGARKRKPVRTKSVMYVVTIPSWVVGCGWVWTTSIILLVVAHSSRWSHWERLAIFWPQDFLISLGEGLSNPYKRVFLNMGATSSNVEFSDRFHDSCVCECQNGVPPTFPCWQTCNSGVSFLD